MSSFLFLLLFGTSYFGFSESDRLGFNVPSQQTREIGFKKEVFENIKTSNENCKKDYVDPNDMLNYVHGSKKMLPSDRKNCPGTSLSKGCENCVSHMQRFVNLFLRATGLKDYVLIHSNSKRVHLDFIIEQKDLEVLQLFADTGKADLTVINEALSNMFTISGNLFEDKSRNFEKERGDETTDTYFNTVLKPFLIILFRLPSEFPQHCITLCVTLVFGITLWQILNSKSWKLSIFSLIFLIFGSGFGWTWFRLYKIADAKRISSRILNDNGSGIPIYCQPDKMSWYQYVYYYYTYEKQCEEYFKREMIDPIVEVSPTIVLAETVTTFILYPVEKIGFAIGSFTTALLDAVPWPYKAFFVPLILLSVVISVIIINVILFGGKLTLRIPFSSFEINSGESVFIQRRCSRPIQSAVETDSTRNNAVPWPYKLFVVPLILIFIAVFIIVISVILVGGKLTFRIPFSSFEIGSYPGHRRLERQFVEDVQPQTASPSIDQQRKTEIKASEESMLSTRKKPSKEITDLFKRLKEIGMSENGSGDKDVGHSSNELVSSNVSVLKSKNDSDFGRTSNTLGNSEVHLHVHIPKCGGDGSEVSYSHKLGKESHLMLLKSEGLDDSNKNVVDNIKSGNLKTKSVVKKECKNKEESDESANSEFK